MARSYRGVRPKEHRVYTVDDLIALYDITRNTVTNWVKAGLTPSDDGRTPYVFRGAMVKQFHEERRARYETRSLHAGEFRCLGCRAAVRPDPTALRRRDNSRGNPWLSGECPECNRMVHKPASPFDLALLDGELIPNTSGDRAHERKTSVPAHTGNAAPAEPTVIHLRNDRTVAAWQRRLGQHSPKTQDRHLAAIREFERFVCGKPFAKLDQEDVAKYREHMRQAVAAKDGIALSKSTVSHKLSHVREFLTWLLKQKGFESLPQDLPDYLHLSRSEYARALPRARRAYPNIEEAEKMLAAMPAQSRLELRARALFAIAFLGALRADTITSLRLGHVLPQERIIVQDGTISRTKNGKSLRVRWFPVPVVFERAVLDWLDEMEAMVAAQDGALFPPGDWIERRTVGRCLQREAAPVMTSPHAVTEAFAAASRAGAKRYTPHAAKHTIAALRGTLSLTEEQRKAWSQNMGHEREQITAEHYGHLTDERCGELFEEMERGQAENGHGELPPGASEELRQLLEPILAFSERHGIRLDRRPA
ncbi:tyrosine-type recombinase/integrase [Jannaschia aquimarina]|uniref:XerC_2 protein n=1 Tax=Jannaschia aquimarina TaxID=935700 RepID=A0A0D1ECP9_9RHOB|nr:tyrosine-type recombinase/integrase [Jannaschia aquimarina]KIT14711.1 Tyrosine recombinase XerC [Jannaschia aquimarina]SNT39737.1 Site-specific recombinase XerD [Jannaschia aquimarina]